jgi:ubiquitin-like-conjugating enzyme ATG3
MVNALSYMRQAREWAMPTRTTSAFLDKGVLTPEEFVIAGDELVFRCPTWAWEAGDPKKNKSYLPVDKQYLVTRNVPCQTRVASMENFVATEGSGGVLDDDDEGDWLVSSIIKQDELEEERKKKQQQLEEDDFDILDEEGEVMKPAAKSTSSSAPVSSSSGKNNQVEDEYADMADYEDDNIMEDDAAASPAFGATNAESTDNDSIIKVRTYDMSITYDKYYQVPRVWIVGKSAQGQPLTGEEMMQDVISDYANRTVTIEHHPHVSGPHASIHPCQHGKVMKAIVRNLIRSTTTGTGEEEEGEEEKGPSVEVYIFIFLKFVSSIIPTINYDFTMDVTADTSK